MDYKDLQKIQKESTEQVLPQQKKVLSAADKIRRKTSNLPDPTHPPMGWKDNKGYDHIFPWIHLPRLHPRNHGDTVIFNASDKPVSQLILGDNLEVLRTLPSESIDLIYIDPPFFSGRNYNVIWGDTNEVRSFYDIWEGGIDSYLVWFNARLWEMRRVLKKTGSIYVHCDWHASHYIKTEMDKIFGYDNFINEIIWSYKGGTSTTRFFPRKHDIIFWYGKTDEFKNNINSAREPYAESTQKDFSKKDEKGYYRLHFFYQNGEKKY
ncbi:MAG: site-specific DNA-methyltransferase, partial [Candidatus Pacebacteria bacterium]|nr:site-specific DNA-methyltransferase [Candidatus Paceibacterota bacterium]